MSASRGYIQFCWRCGSDYAYLAPDDGNKCMFCGEPLHTSELTMWEYEWYEAKYQREWGITDEAYKKFFEYLRQVYVYPHGQYDKELADSLFNLWLCPKCMHASGGYAKDFAKSDDFARDRLCPYCGTKKIMTPLKVANDWNLVIKRHVDEQDRKGWDDYWEQTREKFVAQEGLYDAQLARKQRDQEYRKHVQEKRQYIENAMDELAASLARLDAMPKCPYCRSTNIKKIGMVERVVSVGLLDLASDTIGKSFRCNNCGCTW